MLRTKVSGLALLALAPFIVMATASAAPTLSATQIVEKNVAARGGIGAWRNVQTLSWSGKMEAGGNNQRYVKAPGVAPPPGASPTAPQLELPFVLEMKRGRKQRLELQFDGQTAVQVYDGAKGWKVRPFLNRHQVEAFSADEVKAAATQADLDGQLIDYASKGTRIEVEGVEKVEDREAYKLKLTLKDKTVLHDWVDAQTFLEVKIEGAPRKLDGRFHPVFVYMRDYRQEGGLQIPHVLETTVQGVARVEKISIEKVAVNPRLDDSRFAKPT
jgi:outer membrane lipoprotein-sorting protein